MPPGKDSDGIGLIRLVREIFEAKPHHLIFPQGRKVTGHSVPQHLYRENLQQGGLGSEKFQNALGTLSDTVGTQSHIFDARQRGCQHTVQSRLGITQGPRALILGL